MSDRAYLLKIRLLGIEPAIWRRFVVPARITLDRLHDVIQIVMGWTDSHLHEFTIGKKRYVEHFDDLSWEEEEARAGGEYRLVDLLKRKGRTFSYLYDFGDSWEHEIILEDSRFSTPSHEGELVCLEGERACPPEDVGGVPGYYEFCEALKDPNHAEHESYLLWSGGDYDSERFKVDEVNWELLKYLRWSRDRCQPW